jgi:hypothetical protein
MRRMVYNHPIVKLNPMVERKPIIAQMMYKIIIDL